MYRFTARPDMVPRVSVVGDSGLTGIAVDSQKTNFVTVGNCHFADTWAHTNTDRYTLYCLVGAVLTMTSGRA